MDCISLPNTNHARIIIWGGDAGLRDCVEIDRDIKPTALQVFEKTTTTDRASLRHRRS